MLHPCYIPGPLNIKVDALLHGKQVQEWFLLLELAQALFQTREQLDMDLHASTHPLFRSTSPFTKRTKRLGVQMCFTTHGNLDPCTLPQPSSFLKHSLYWQNHRGPSFWSPLGGWKYGWMKWQPCQKAHLWSSSTFHLCGSRGSRPKEPTADGMEACAITSWIPTSAMTLQAALNVTVVGC